MAFKAPFCLRNSHLQTLYPSLFKKKQTLAFNQKIFWLEDGDFLEPFWLEEDYNKEVVVVLHGLGGSFRSAYVSSLMSALKHSGFSVVLMHFRGCGTQANNKPRSYHSGDTADFRFFVESLSKKTKDLHAIGFSLGANVLLKYLGEFGQDSLIKSAMAVSPPMKLDVCSNSIGKGFSRFYQYILLRELKGMFLEKYRRFGAGCFSHVDEKTIRGIATFWEFDDLYTAVVHGFDSAASYYKESSSFYYLKAITTPTLILHAQDDAFMDERVIPTVCDVSKSVELEIPLHGGHVGFVEGSLFAPKYYVDKRAVEFFVAHSKR